MRGKKPVVSDETPVLPRFPSMAYDIIVTFADGTTETIKVMARGRASAIQTAAYSMTRLSDDKISTITTVSFGGTLTDSMP